ncbi:MAG: DHH family phosphoesterase [Desulfobacterales bacterium]|jgi:phosphoesterase RecJ-like protein|nr:DHH family phosphoesterase [Desulfobacterales bacterium]
MDPILQRIKAAGHLLVASHAEPDGDAIGSLLALGLALEKMGKRTTLFNASAIPAVYQFLPGVARITRRMPSPGECDAAVILDCGDLTRIGPEWPEAARIAVIINIDHHITNTRFGHFQLIDGDACATAEIVHRLIPLLGVEFDQDIATAVYTGILTDTGSFRFSNTNAAAFAISREMTERGVDPYHVARHVFGSYSLGRIKLLNLALNSIEISPNGKLSIMTITRGMLAETGTQPEDVDGLINYARRIEDVKVAALIQEQANGEAAADGRAHFHVSLRSDGTVDVAAWAGGFGGGGHRSAAGFQVAATLNEIKARLTGWSVGM